MEATWPEVVSIVVAATLALVIVIRTAPRVKSFLHDDINGS